jgi:hypothetical protein
VAGALVVGYLLGRPGAPLRSSEDPARVQIELQLLCNRALEVFDRERLLQYQSTVRDHVVVGDRGRPVVSTVGSLGKRCLTTRRKSKPSDARHPECRR